MGRWSLDLAVGSRDVGVLGVKMGEPRDLLARDRVGRGLFAEREVVRSVSPCARGATGAGTPTRGRGLQSTAPR